MAEKITLEEIGENNLLIFLHDLIKANGIKIEEQKELIDDLRTSIEVLEGLIVQ